MPLEEFLFSEESIKYTGAEEVEYQGSTYNFYITNMRLILHARKGLVFKKERIVSEKLPEIQSMHYKEKGLARKKGILRIETLRKKIDIIGSRDNIKAILKELQKYIKLPETEEPKVREVKEKEIITKEVVMIPCPHCQTLMPQTAVFCPHCGAPKRRT